MHASMFNLDLGVCATTRDRARRGRSLAATLADLPGFVAFIVLEAEDGTATGLCICVDTNALESVHQKVEDWQHDVGGRGLSAPAHPHIDPSSCLGIQGQSLPVILDTLAIGEVIVQRGF